MTPLIKIDFESESHTYRIDGKPVGGVTTILKEEGFIDTRWYKPSGTSRGSIVHELTEAIDRGELTAATMLGSDVYPYLKAWEQFKQDVGKIKWILIEVPIGSKAGYAGIEDRIAEINDKITLIDIKSGQHELWHGLQLAAYARAAKETFGIDVQDRRVVRVKNNGKYIVDDKDKKIGPYSSPLWDQYWNALVLSRSIRNTYAKIKPGAQDG